MQSRWLLYRFPECVRGSSPTPGGHLMTHCAQTPGVAPGIHSTPQEIADIINQEFHRLDGIVRTKAAVVVQITRRGLSRWMAGYRLHEVEQLFHFDHRAIHRHWLQPGLLVPTRTFNGRGTARDNYVFTDDDLLRFVRGHPWAYDFRRLRRPE